MILVRTKSQWLGYYCFVYSNDCDSYTYKCDAFQNMFENMQKCCWLVQEVLRNIIYFALLHYPNDCRYKLTDAFRFLAWLKGEHMLWIPIPLTIMACLLDFQLNVQHVFYRCVASFPRLCGEWKSSHPFKWSKSLPNSLDATSRKLLSVWAIS